MRAGRWILTMVLAVAGLGLTAPAAAGGGGTWLFEGQHRDADGILVSGERVRATTLLRLDGVGPKAKEGAYWGGPQHGPFYGYIAPRNPNGPGFYAPPLPENAIRVGEVAFEETKDPEVLEAVLEFVVPEVKAGYYALHHCNDPCTRQIGDTWTTRITIVDDEDDAFLARWSSRIERRLARTQPGVRIRIRNHTAKLERLTAVTRSLRTELEDLEQQDAAADARPRPIQAADESSWPLLVLAATILALAAMLVRERSAHRRHRASHEHQAAPARSTT